MSFIKTSTVPIYNADPDLYHLIGADIPKGKPEFVMSRTALQDFGACPRKWLRAPKVKPSKAMKWGDLVDCLFLLPELFEAKFAVAPETYPCEPTKRDPRAEKPWNYQADYCKDWRAQREAEGKRTTEAETVEKAQQAVKLLHADSVISDLYRHSDRQVQVQVAWKDDATGLIIPVRVLADLVPKADSRFGSMAVDFKTTFDAAPEQWQKHINDQGYYYQAAFYLDALNVAMDLEYTEFANIVQESAEPFEVARRLLSSDYLAMGRAEYRRHFALYCQSVKENFWPGYEEWDLENTDFPVVEGFRQIGPPPWIMRKMARQLAEE